MHVHTCVGSCVVCAVLLMHPAGQDDHVCVQTGSPVLSGLQRQNTFPLNPNHAASESSSGHTGAASADDSQIPLDTCALVFY